MELRSVLVNVGLEPASSDALACAIALATRFDAQIIGLAADLPSMVVAGFDAGTAAVDLYSIERAEIETRLRAAEEAFQSIVPQGLRKAWRSLVTPPAYALADAARSADLIVTGGTVASTYGETSNVDVGEVVLTSGRPVIVISEGARDIKAERIVIGWKDTREARRAVVDAMPFLHQAKDVVAFTVSEGQREVEQASLKDLLAWLRSHGIEAQGDVLTNENGISNLLEVRARAHRADLVVTGGYGHSRVREWIFGGMTRELLQTNALNRFLSN